MRHNREAKEMEFSNAERAPIVLELRREVDPALYTGFEYLCDELKRKEPQLNKTLNEALANKQPLPKN